MADTTQAETSHVKVALASLIGSAIEWYDFFLYGTAAALIFNKLYFPTFDPAAGTLLAFGTFALGFFARPLGGLVFGHYGDKLGRKTMLYLTLLIMGTATAIIGLLPTYDDIGIWAAVLLIVCRLAQGFGLGGEWGGAVLMAVEHAPHHRRGFFGSWPQMGAPLGLVLGTLVFSTVSGAMSEGDFMAWGWRIPFLFSIVLVAIGLWIRFTIAESPEFQRIKDAKQEAGMPILEAIKTHPKNILLAMGARFAENGFFYIYATFTLAYATQALGMNRQDILNAVLLAASIEVLTIRRLAHSPTSSGGARSTSSARYSLRSCRSRCSCCSRQNLRKLPCSPSCLASPWGTPPCTARRRASSRNCSARACATRACRSATIWRACLQAPCRR